MIRESTVLLTISLPFSHYCHNNVNDSNDHNDTNRY